MQPLLQWKSKILLHILSVFVALDIQHLMRMRHTVICSLPGCTIVLPHYLVKGTILENITEHKIVYVEIKCQLDATEVFSADLIACSTYFGHHFVHHQELEYYTVVAACGIWCCGFHVVGLVWS